VVDIERGSNGSSVYSNVERGFGMEDELVTSGMAGLLQIKNQKEE
jgi:hypothetical protein